MVYKLWTKLLRGQLLLLLLTALLSAGFVGQVFASNILTVGIQLEPPNLDPTQGAAAAVDEVVYANLFEGLTSITADGSVTPKLAKRWEIFENGRRYRFFLQDNVRFHDGSAFTAEDVKFSLERAAAADSVNAQKSLFEPIENIEVVSPTIVDISLSHAVGSFLTHLAWGDAVIVAPETAASNATTPVGTGPFMFSRWRKGVSIDLLLNPSYWGAASNTNEHNLDGLSFRIVPDPTAAFASLLAGEIDGFPAYPAPENLEQFRRHADFNVLVGTSEGETILAINNAAPSLNDIRVRRALNYAIDKQAIINGAMFGYGQPIGSHFPPHHASYLDLSNRYAHDVVKAKNLLMQAGYAQDLELSLKLPPPSYARRSGEIIAAQLNAIGVQVNIENLEWAQWLNQVFTNKNFELTIVSHTEPLDLDIYARDNYYFGYDDVEYKKLIAKLSVTNDLQERDGLFKRAQRKLSEDAVNVFLFQSPKMGVWAKGIEGVWVNSPVQANDVTAVQRYHSSNQSSNELDSASSKSVVAPFVASLLGLSFLLVVAYLAYRAGANFVFRRLATLVITMAVATMVIFTLVEVAPGDPAEFMMGLNAEPEALSALRTEMGLDKSVLHRYFSWVGGALRGDFGTSFTYQSSVAQLMSERLQVSLPLAIYALTLALLIAIPVGIIAARHRASMVGGAIISGTQLGIAIPNFWLAILLVLGFASGLRWFPVGGFPGWQAGILPGLYALTLPAIALAVPQAAILVRVVRSALLDTLNEDYIRTARAKGLSQDEALKYHALRNAAIPVLTILGLQFSFLLAGGIIVENVFYLPGLGRLVFQAILQRDLIVVESVVLVLAFATVLISFLVDLIYAAVDPRLRSRRVV